MKCYNILQKVSLSFCTVHWRNRMPQSWIHKCWVAGVLPNPAEQEVLRVWLDTLFAKSECFSQLCWLDLHWLNKSLGGIHIDLWLYAHKSKYSNVELDPTQWVFSPNFVQDLGIFKCLAPLGSHKPGHHLFLLLKSFFQTSWRYNSFYFLIKAQLVVMIWSVCYSI